MPMYIHQSDPEPPRLAPPARHGRLFAALVLVAAALGVLIVAAGLI